ncbi:hypothetical protein GGTG_04720 [Gaeumannomyces tritici R3-111a-1]|uniref:Uncharacterized protein n=1 Tax=Gaeumannomyces tritici (strain R3-111a-1) TaxID=644352 RepID=J3NTX1_GAET3|nr:hypothetical protein GGTG_04720 [Gaeumannomyces tritici R3-111a-1]EJT79636.1 hypothetical protein GGTG_04720 [Gaeumannomyces tritici R3-111a-1]
MRKKILISNGLCNVHYLRKKRGIAKISKGKSFYPALHQIAIGWRHGFYFYVVNPNRKALYGLYSSKGVNKYIYIQPFPPPHYLALKLTKLKQLNPRT